MFSAVFLYEFFFTNLKTNHGISITASERIGLVFFKKNKNRTCITIIFLERNIIKVK